MVKVNELLHHATENGYGVAAVNVFNYETIKWVAEAANRERIPVIIQFYPGFEQVHRLKTRGGYRQGFRREIGRCPSECIWTIPPAMR